MGFPTYNHADGSVYLERRDKAGDFTPENCYGQRIETAQQQRAATKFTIQIAEEMLLHRRAGTALSELARECGSTQGFTFQLFSNKRRRHLELNPWSYCSPCCWRLPLHKVK
jgi:hypothetical protein